jgi:hypothetical protein
MLAVMGLGHAARGAPARVRFGGSCWPGPEEELLLKAALLDGVEAADAWRSWQAGDRLERAQLSERRLLPAVCRNLVRLGVDDHELGRLRGIHRYDWYRNQLLFDASARLIEALEARGVPTLVLKGAALATLHYRDVGSRPMSDVDVLVPPELAVRAIDAARQAGWSADPPPPRDLLSVSHAWSYRNGSDGPVDLHWRAFAYSHADERDLWTRAVPLALASARTRAMSPADELFHVCVHGLEWNPVSPIRWVPDAVWVMRSAGGDLDWETLCSMATRHGFSRTIAELLAYLRATFGAEVPSAVVARLGAVATSRRDRNLENALMARPHRVRRSMRIHWAAYRALKCAHARGARRINFATFLLQRWRLGGLADLPRFAVHKLGLRLRAGAR